MNKINAELAIIGAGAAGLSLASGAAQLGLDVVLIEAAEMGGDCLNFGCVPSKTLLSIAKSIYFTRNNKYIIRNSDASSIDFTQVMQSVDQVIQKISVHDSEERFTRLGVKVIRAQASFISHNELSAGDYNIKAKKIVIATGSKAFIPTINGIDIVPYLTNENIFKLKALPQHLMVIGGGPIGCEMAQAFAMLGSQVTLLEAFQILPKDDPECVAIIREKLIEAGVTLYEGAQIDAVSQVDHTQIQIKFKHSKQGQTSFIVGTHLLVATGRKSCVAGLSLEKADVAFTAKGIQVDSRLRTTNKSIYAIGDVIGSLQFTHAANYHAGIVLKNIAFKIPSRLNPNEVPWVTYTYPEIAHAGYLANPKIQSEDIKEFSLSMSENDRAQAEQELNGKIKVWVNKKGKILSVTIVDVHAGELILPWIMAIQQGRTLKSFTDAVTPYPTRSELSKRVSGLFYAPKLFSDKVRRLVKLIQKVG